MIRHDHLIVDDLTDGQRAGARARICVNELSCPGSRCAMKTKATPVSGGKCETNWVNASRPPADAPIPTMRQAAPDAAWAVSPLSLGSGTKACSGLRAGTRGFVLTLEVLFFPFLFVATLTLPIQF